MTEEENKVVGDLKKLCIEVLENDDLSNYDNLSPTEKMTMISIILNLIQKQQEEIELSNKVIDKRNQENLELTEMCLKKDKVINLMAKQMSAVCTGLSVIREQFEKDYCEFINSDEDCCWKTDKVCVDCIKEYFEKKVEDK